MLTKNHNTAREVWVAIGLFWAGLVCYGNSFSVPFHFDDLLVIVENPYIKSPDKIFQLWLYDPSRFITHLSFAVNCWIHGLSVFGFHLVNLILHVTAAFLIYRLALFVVRERGESEGIAVIAAFLFLAHPIQTQSVTYIVQRAVLLASVCYLISLLTYLRSRADGDKRFYVIAFVSMAIGLFTKPIIVSLPAALLLFEIFVPKKKRPWQRVMMSILPFVILALAVPVLLSFWKHKTIDPAQIIHMTRETSKYTRTEYLLTQFNVSMTYLRLLILPVHQNLDYNYPVARSFFQFPTWLSFCGAAAVLSAAVYFFKRQRMISFCVFWMAVTLALESSFFPIGDVINEHRLYLPMFGFALLVGYGAVKLIRDKQILIFICVVMTAGLGWLTYQRNIVWQDRLGLLRDMSDKAPDKARIQNNLGIAYSDEANFTAAVEAFQKSIEIDANFKDPRNNLANTYYRMGQRELAIQELKRAIEIDPEFAGAYYNLGNIFWREGDLGAAREQFSLALKANPSFVRAIVAMGKIYMTQGQMDKALFHFNSAVYMDPGFADSYANLGDLYLRMGDHPRAITAYRQALQRDPRLVVAYNHLGNIFDMRQDYLQAEGNYRKALDVDPACANAYFNLANTLRKTGRVEEARSNLRMAIQYYGMQGNRAMLERGRERLKELGHQEK
jgi:tetratricopeptide (TPR) repeat protein